MTIEQAQTIVEAVERYRPNAFEVLNIAITTDGTAAVAYKSHRVPSTVQNWFRDAGAVSNHTGSRKLDGAYVDVLWFRLKEAVEL